MTDFALSPPTQISSFDEADYRRYVVVLICALVLMIGLFGRALNPVFVNDQAEMLILSQSLEWVYDEQPPLYAWIARAALQWSGNSVFVLDLIKYAFLSIAVWGIYAIGNTLSPYRGAGILAIGLAFTLPTLGEDALGEATHSVALIAAAVVSAYVLLRNLQTPSRWLWLVLAVIWTLGLAFKHTMVALVAAQCVGVWFSGSPVRVRIVRQMLPAAVIMLVVNAVYYVELLQAPAALGNGLQEFHMAASSWAFLRGLLDLMTSTLTEAALLWLIVLGFWVWVRFGSSRRSLRQTPGERFLAVSVGAFLVMVALLVIATNTSVVRDRWLAPALVFMAPLVAARLTIFIGSTGLRLLMGASLAFVLTNAGFRAWEGATARSSATIASRDLANDLIAQSGTPDLILADAVSIAANLYLRTGSPTAYPNGYMPPRLSEPDTVLVVWQGIGAMPPRLSVLLDGVTSNQPGMDCQEMPVRSDRGDTMARRGVYSSSLCVSRIE